MGIPIPRPYEAKVVAIDLDGTLAEAMYPSPEIGAPIQKTVDAAIEYRLRGYEVRVYTSRPEDHRDRIERWLRVNGLEDVFYTVVTGKMAYALLIDDRAVAFPEAFEEPSARRMEPRRMNPGPRVSGILGEHDEGRYCAAHQCEPV